MGWHFIHNYNPSYFRQLGENFVRHFEISLTFPENQILTFQAYRLLIKYPTLFLRRKNITNLSAVTFSQDNTFGKFSTIFHKGDNLCNFLYAFLQIKLL